MANLLDQHRRRVVPRPMRSRVVVACLTALLALASITSIANAASDYVVEIGRKRMVDVVKDEIDRLEATFALPPIPVNAIEPLPRKDAYTFVSSVPVKSFVAVVEWRFWRETPTRRVAVHEVYHVLANEHGWSQDERLADIFAECYSSVGRRDVRTCSEVDRIVESVRRP